MKKTNLLILSLLTVFLIASLVKAESAYGPPIDTIIVTELNN